MSAPLNLEPIRERSDVAREKPCLANWERTGEDVPALIAEVERLRTENECYWAAVQVHAIGPGTPCLMCEGLVRERLKEKATP